MALRREDAKAIEEKITKLVGEDWNTQKARIYITTIVLETETAVKGLQESLKEERKINQRVETALAGWLRRITEGD